MVLSRSVFSFFKELKAKTIENRDWFTENKPTFKELRS